MNSSFDELGVYDTTAGIDFILNKTGHDKLHMGGYSFGATICLIALAERPEYNDKIDKLILIVPTARMKYYDRRLIILKIFPYLFHVRISLYFTLVHLSSNIFNLVLDNFTFNLIQDYFNRTFFII